MPHLRRPLIIAVSGGSGSGKTTFAKTLRSRISDCFAGNIKVSIISQDSYYHDQSGVFAGDGSINFDHPDAIDFQLLGTHLSQFQKGESLKVPVYDFVTHHRLSEFKAVDPADILIVDGIFVLYQEFLRDFYFSSIFLDVAEELRFQRRLKRDVEERGRTKEGVRTQFYSSVKPMHDLFVQPTLEFAKYVISNEDQISVVSDEILHEIQKFMG